MSNYRVSLSFAQLSDAELGAFTENVIASLTGNAAYPTPIVAIPALTTAWQAFTDALAATINGGPQETAAKNAAREALTALLRQEAGYVQGVASDDLSVLLSSGFSNTSTNRAQTPLDKPTVLEVLNEMSTQLVARLKPVANARAYEMQIRNGTGGFVSAGIFTKARRVVLTNLTPGGTYTIQGRAIGGSTGYSDWSDPVSHMAM
jgi:hypothetical protein